MKTIEDKMYDQAFEEGVRFAQRFIQIDEKLPPVDCHVILKFINYRGNIDYWVGILKTEERLHHFLDQHLKFTHWRPIEF